MSSRFLSPFAPENRVVGILRESSTVKDHPNECECEACENLHRQASSLIDEFEDDDDDVLEDDAYDDDDQDY